MLPTLLLMLGTTCSDSALGADGSPAWSALEPPDSSKRPHILRHRSGRRSQNGARGTAVFGTETTQRRNASQDAVVFLWGGKKGRSCC
ncbi:hypothetical protein HDV63DRAFT_361848 [Trichoderma sp. SZMC 28014]